MKLIALAVLLTLPFLAFSQEYSGAENSSTTTYIKKKGKNGRRPFRQLGFSFIFRENVFDVPDAYRYGITYSSGHIKDNSRVGYYSEFSLDVFSQDITILDESTTYSASTGSLLFGLLVKIYKSRKVLVYGKAAGGAFVSSTFEDYEYEDYKWDYNYHFSAGANYKLGRKIGLFVEGGYSRTYLMNAGLSLMRD